MSIHPFHADLPFRAHRTYVHSTSLCNFLRSRYPGFTRLELVLKSWMDSRVIFTPVSAVQPGQGSGFAKLQVAGEDIILSLSEDKEHPVSGREPFDEAALAGPSDVTGRSLLCRPGAGGTFFDRLISTNKALINSCLNPGVSLIAAKVVLEQQLADDAVFTLTLVSNTGTRIFKSHLLVDGHKTGEVIFYGQ